MAWSPFLRGAHQHWRDRGLPSRTPLQSPGLSCRAATEKTTGRVIEPVEPADISKRRGSYWLADVAVAKVSAVGLSLGQPQDRVAALETTDACREPSMEVHVTYLHFTSGGPLDGPTTANLPASASRSQCRQNPGWFRNPAKHRVGPLLWFPVQGCVPAICQVSCRSMCRPLLEYFRLPPPSSQQPANLPFLTPLFVFAALLLPLLFLSTPDPRPIAKAVGRGGNNPLTVPSCNCRCQ